MARPPVVLLSGVRWGFLWQRHHALATCFARAGYTTVFVETTGLANPRPSALAKVKARLLGGGAGRDVGDGLIVYSPRVLPPTLAVFREANQRFLVPRVARALGRVVGKSPIVVAYPPTRTTLDLISALDPRLVFYDRADDYRRFPGVPKDLPDTERELLMRADLVSCTSTPLLEGARRLRPDAFLSGPAVDYDLFAPVRERPPALPPRTVGFFGQLGRERIDSGILRAVAGAGYRVRLVGDADRADGELLREPNVEYVGEIPHQRLPEALDGVDALLLPYKKSPLARAISPAKTYECLATGRPVVATPLPAMAELRDHVYLADGPQDFVGALRALRDTETGERAMSRTRLAQENSWEARFREVEERIRGALGAGT